MIRDVVVRRGFCHTFAAGLVALALSAAGGCQLPPRETARTQIRIATGSKVGVYEPLGGALAEIYNARIPDVSASAFETTGSVFNLRAIENGRAELAFTQADVAYSAFRHGVPGDSRPYENVRAIAVLYVNAVQIIVLRTSPIYRLQDLAGRRVGVGAHESGTEVAAHVILETVGLEPEITAESLTFDQIAGRMKRGELDAGFIVSSYPVPAIQALMNTADIRLLAIEPSVSRRVRSEYPFLRPVRIPQATYMGQTGDVPTLGVDNLLVCRADLPDELVQRLTRVFIESLPALSAVHSAAGMAAGMIDPLRAPAAPIPVHPGATRFYRERELFQ